MKIRSKTLILFLVFIQASASAGDVVDYPPPPPSRSIMEVIDAFWTLVATVRGFFFPLLILGLLYYFWLRRRARTR
jgi:hypothetical protein